MGDYIRRLKTRTLMCSSNPPPSTFGYTDYQDILFAAPSVLTESECGDVPNPGPLDVMCIAPRSYLHMAETSPEGGGIRMLRANANASPVPHTFSSVGHNYFVASDYASIYAFPSLPVPAPAKTIAVISLGGGLFGTRNSGTGVLTNGDCQTYWSAYCNIAPENQPKVVVYPILGAVPNASGDIGSTYENTIDVATIGACYPSSNLTIVMILAPITNVGFYTAFQTAINGFTIAGVHYQPNVVSCSWGAPERSTWWSSPYTPASYNTLFATAVSRGISVCAASGDSGSSDGSFGLNVDFPAAATNSIACGGTRLVCPNRVYDSRTTETAWASGGGGMSVLFSMSAGQASVKSATNNLVLRTANTKRCVPDVAMVADPNTMVAYLVNGTLYGFGGTSLVAPAMSAFIARMNLATSVVTATRLYSRQASGGFHDIVSGSNGSNGSYSSRTGFDLCTGLGSLIGSRLV